MKSRNSYLLRRFGITEDQYAALLGSQDGRCAICRRPPTDFKNKLAVDHDHKTGEIRGVLCYRCNKFVVGRNTLASAPTLLAAFEYLNRTYTGWIVPPKKKKRKKKRHGKLRRTKPRT